MTEKAKTIEAFAKQILPEFLPSKLEIEIYNPTISKIGLFDRLYVLGYTRHKPPKKDSAQPTKEPFVTLLNKTHMEYSCFLAYSAGCIKGKFGNTLSRKDYMEMLQHAAKVGKEYFL